MAAAPPAAERQGHTGEGQGEPSQATSSPAVTENTTKEGDNDNKH